jgi:hypothetical protein
VEHKIFVSYAHVNDLPDPGAEKGWVSVFVDFLNARLPGKIGRAEEVSIWKDDRLSRHEPVTPALYSAISSSSIFLMIASEGYLASEWCKDRELPRFISENLPGRIFRVELDKIDRTRLPEQLRDVVGYKFWTEDSQSRVRRTLIGVPQRFADEQFFRMLDILVQEMAGVLKRTMPAPPHRRTNGDQRQGGALAPQLDLQREAAIGPCVFLGGTVTILDEERSRVMTYLRQAGLRVLTPETLPFERDSYLKALDAALTKSVVFVQLLGPEAAVADLEDAASDIELQFLAAKRLGLAILQWRDPALDLNTVADEKHREILKANSVEKMGIEEFKAFVAKRALTKVSTPEPPRPPPEDSPLNGYVFLNRAVEDLNTAKPIAELLSELKIDCMLPLDRGDPEQIRTDLEENLRDCEALIIVYGDASPGWVRAQLRQYRRARRERPLIVHGIYDGPPANKDDLGVVLPGLKVIPCREGFARDKLIDFLMRR